MYSSSLYKIKPLDRRNIENIANDEIWVPQASSLNDPYDCSILPHLKTDIEINELQELLNELANEAEIFNHVVNAEYFEAKSKQDKNWIAHQTVCQRIKSIGILSFIDTPYNIVTWSHYGNEHKGICIEFSPVSDNYLERFKIYLGGYRLQSVSYTNNIPRIDWHEFLRSPRILLEIILRTKFRDWSYENESRIITYNESGNKALKLEKLGLKMTKVFVGCEVEESDELALLEDVCTRKNIPLQKLERLHYSYGLQNMECYE
ncbi:DUF2971 domain-containing protein [Aliikangiella maris]|uniref:DUF2971 domain-containing protein n=2 Tax=Aliikangiella maris TaxID=3162458 RepID=A0ABV3MLH3_9GAMM